MIYTVTLNPSLDYIVSVDHFQVGCTNRTASELLLPGGKGINVSIVLRNFGVQSKALGFCAGFVGEEIQKQLQTFGIETDFVRLQSGNSRINIKLRIQEETEVNGAGPVVAEADLAPFLERIERLANGDVVFLSGSIPPSVSREIYGMIAERLKGRGVLTVVDAEGSLLLPTLPHHPFLIKPNHHELGAIFGVELRERSEVIPYGRKLQEMGACNVLISMAGDGAVLLAQDGSAFSRPAPAGELVNGVGAGDSMAAGFVAGWLERHSYAYAFDVAMAAGSASAFAETFCTKAEMEAVYRRLPALDGKD